MSGLWQRIWRWRNDRDRTLDSELSSDAVDILSDLAQQRRLPGIAISVMRKGEVLLQGGWGYANLEKQILMDPVNTLTRAASASKPIASMAIGKLVASGLMDWDTSFYAYVPSFPRKKYDFTLRQLASHTAGIRGYKGKEYALNKPMSIRDSLTVFQDDPLLFQPGSSYHYNSFDWVMLSVAVEEITGLSFEAFVRNEILDPLGMERTRPEIPGDKHPEIAQFYSPARSGFRKASEVDNRYKLAGGGYLTTAVELAQFGQACLEFKILDEGAMGEIWNAQTIEQQSTYYGLGWEVSEDDQGRPYYGHRGNSVGAYSNFYLYPEEELVFVALINSTDPGVQDRLDEIIDICLKME